MRFKSFKAAVETSNIDAYLISDVKNVFYFTGFRDVSNSALHLLVSPKDEPVLLVPKLSLSAAIKNAKNCIVKGLNFGEKSLSQLFNLIRNLGAKTIHFDTLPVQTYVKIIKMLDILLVPNPELVMALRRIKDQTEISYIRKASELTSIGVNAGMQAIKPGVKEYEIAAAMEYAMRRLGSEGTSFETIVASGPRSAYPHGIASTRVIQKGDIVTLDLGATYAGYCSDLTRTVVVGVSSSKQLQILDLVLRANTEVLNKLRAGEKAKDIDAVARRIITEGGYGKYFIHGLGHGVGLSIHELPVLSPTSEDILEDGNVVTNEPGVYIEDFGGVRFEDTVLVQNNRAERLTEAPYFL